jgi:hypothetical protein
MFKPLQRKIMQKFQEQVAEYPSDLRSTFVVRFGLGVLALVFLCLFAWFGQSGESDSSQPEVVSESHLLSSIAVKEKPLSLLRSRMRKWDEMQILFLDFVSEDFNVDDAIALLQELRSSVTASGYRLRYFSPNDFKTTRLDLLASEKELPAMALFPNHVRKDGWIVGWSSPDSGMAMRSSRSVKLSGSRS